MKQFSNIFAYLSASANMNFRLLAEHRRNQMIAEGYDVSRTNWEHYARVLEAKHQQLKNS